MKQHQQYLYHSLSYNLTENLKKLESILSSGYIMTRDSLKEHLTEKELNEYLYNHITNWNENDSISLAYHPKNLKLFQKYQNNKLFNQDNAYQEYTKNTTSLVLDTNLLKILLVKDGTKRMNYELQIQDNIPITYLKAIAINYSNSHYSSNDIFRFKSILKELTNNYKGKNYYQYYQDVYYIEKDFHQYSLEQLYQEHCFINQYIEELRRLLSKYSINIPIIDINYGYEIPNQNKNNTRIKKLKKQYETYLYQKLKD